MTSDASFGVLLVGSGPAGSIAALVLARAGGRVALVDTAAFSHDADAGPRSGSECMSRLPDPSVGRREAP